MKRIQYISRWTKPLTPDEIQKIVNDSDVYNSQNKISGFLISLDDIFFQLIEGEDNVIDDLYFSKIAKDSRHKDIICLKNESGIQESTFADWSMKQFNLNIDTHLIPDVVKVMFNTLMNSQEILSKYTQPSVIKILNNGIDPTSTIPIKVNKVILMIDIIGFTMLSEKFSADSIVQLVNDFITICCDNVNNYGGEVTKLMGDSVLAVFPENFEKKAVDSSIKILSDIEKLRQSNKEGAPYNLLHGGIGISSGSVVEGNIGSNIKNDYTVIGNAVNLASRLESLTRKLNRFIIVSNEVYEKTSIFFDYEALGSQKLKGKLENKLVYSLKKPGFIKMDGIYKKISMSNK